MNYEWYEKQIAELRALPDDYAWRDDQIKYLEDAVARFRAEDASKSKAPAATRTPFDGPEAPRPKFSGEYWEAHHTGTGEYTLHVADDFINARAERIFNEARVKAESTGQRFNADVQRRNAMTIATADAMRLAQEQLLDQIEQSPADQSLADARANLFRSEDPGEPRYDVAEAIRSQDASKARSERDFSRGMGYDTPEPIKWDVEG
jgi:hypothetical protein